MQSVALPAFTSHGFLLMQSVATPAFTSAGLLLLTVVVGLGLFIITLVAIVIGGGHARHRREAEHQERMKALECGVPIPEDAPWWTPNRVAAGIGVGVPVFAFAVAFQATRLSNGPQDIAIWASAGAVSVAAVICGSVLTYHLLASSPPRPRVPHAKAAFDPDSYDTAGRRG